MWSTARGFRSGLAGVLVAVLAAAGCREAPDGYERTVPAADAARRAVTAALESWRNGESTEQPVGTRPPVYVVDKLRRKGQRLSGFSVLGELPAEHARCLAVRLTLADPEEQYVVRYFVVGLDPVWVFRQEDYEMISHWMHPMEDAAPAADAPGTRP